MNKLLMLLTMLILVCANVPVANCQRSQQTKSISLPFDLEKEKQLQLEVDNGHQPWRLEAIEVAQSVLYTQNIIIPADKCKMSSKAAREATVICSGAKTYTVRLKQLIKCKGIWTAIEIQIGE